VDAASADSIAYLARILIQTNLPHRDPGDIVAWSRRNGDFLLQITPGVSRPDDSNQSHRLGIPYGTYPRLILSWVTTEVLRTKSPECGFRPCRSAIPGDADHPFRQGDHPGRDAAG
jgi:hypothetical protein